MRVPNKLAQFLGKIVALGISCAAVALNPSASMSMPHQAKPADLSGIENVEEQRGPFAIGEQNYTVLMHFKRLATAANDPFAQSLAGLEIRDAAGTVTCRSEKRFEGRSAYRFRATQWAEGKTVPAENYKGLADEAGGFGVAADSDLWLKVRIDGKEGWMHSEEDFRALGLPEDE